MVAGLLMVTGIAWNAGLEARPFQPAMMGVTALVIHIVPLAALMFVLVPVLVSATARRTRMTVAAVIALAFGVFSAVFSITHPHAVAGIHDFNDVLPIAILDAGALLWLVRGAGAQAQARSTARPHDPRRSASSRSPRQNMPGWQDAPQSGWRGRRS